MEPNMMINLAAGAIFGAIAAYVLVLALREAHGVSVTARTAELEQSLLNRRIDDLLERGRLEREREQFSWSGWRKFEVMERVEEGGDICSFYLSPHDKRPLPPYLPGQFLTFNLKLPGSSSPVVRCYSLSDAPHQEKYRISVKRQAPPRDESKADIRKSSSNWLHDNARVGDILDVKAPAGHFYLDPAQRKPVVLIGGGVGITPVLSMLNTLLERNSEQEIWFFYGVRCGREHIMKDHLKRLALQHPNARLRVCYSDPEDGDIEGEHFQHGGRVGVDLFRDLLPSNNYDFLFCGPPPMMKSLYEGLLDWGVPDERIHFEAFGPASIKRIGQTKQVDEVNEATEGFTITFARSDKALTWDGKADSLLDLAEANGIPMEAGCRAGNCGTCITAIKAGTSRHTIIPSAAAEPGTCLACCSVPTSDLTLEA